MHKEIIKHPYRKVLLHLCLPLFIPLLVLKILSSKTLFNKNRQTRLRTSNVSCFMKFLFSDSNPILKKETYLSISVNDDRLSLCSPKLLKTYTIKKSFQEKNHLYVFAFNNTIMWWTLNDKVITWILKKPFQRKYLEDFCELKLEKSLFSVDLLSRQGWQTMSQQIYWFGAKNIIFQDFGQKSNLIMYILNQHKKNLVGNWISYTSLWYSTFI